jgi:hypothetical protein
VLGRKNWSMFIGCFVERLESLESRRFEGVMEELMRVFVAKNFWDLAQRVFGSSLPSKEVGLSGWDWDLIETEGSD